ncbi:serine acetyltransferase [Alteromonas sp. CI.11.F.A3]|uniref:serine O-acetyltransferase n=1 Tax=Alteromonas TaxID=226 RepID=UPI0007B434CE|nr:MULTISPECIES: serine acetyltransferase [Alteromonas]ANB26848.1 serine acetyltransferase [Alteromonas stellipolaris]WOI36105.1 serine acetyltransferase [Alteromonas sp. CI.11.F.A3]
MIKSKADYLLYLEQDRLALGIKPSLKDRLTHDIWHFQKALRKLEYRKNTASNILVKLYAIFLQLRVRKLGRKLGFSIPANVFGPGLSIAHAGTIVINGRCKIGANCRLHVCINIGGGLAKKANPPVIGNNCYIGPGAKIYGNIKIGNNVAIGANAVVNKSCGDNLTLGGIPAKVISDKGPIDILQKPRASIN